MTEPNSDSIAEQWRTRGATAKSERRRLVLAWIVVALTSALCVTGWQNLWQMFISPADDERVTYHWNGYVERESHGEVNDDGTPRAAVIITWTINGRSGDTAFYRDAVRLLRDALLVHEERRTG